MKNGALYKVSLVIMVIALLGMGTGLLIGTLPDWVIRTTGIVILIDLVVLSYSTVRMKHKEG